MSGSGFDPHNPLYIPNSQPARDKSGKPIKFQTIPDQDGSGNSSGKDYTTRTYGSTVRRNRGPIGGHHHR